LKASDNSGLTLTLGSTQKRLTMSKLITLIQGLLAAPAAQQDADEAYFAQSVDINDLERRMREVDDRGRSMVANPMLTAGWR